MYSRVSTQLFAAPGLPIGVGKVGTRSAGVPGARYSIVNSNSNSNSDSNSNSNSDSNSDNSDSDSNSNDIL